MMGSLSDGREEFISSWIYLWGDLYGESPVIYAGLIFVLERRRMIFLYIQSRQSK
jgi:hypothetical protein